MITVLTPPAALRRQMVRATLRAWEATPAGDPLRAVLAVQLESLRKDCPHEHTIPLLPRAVLCRDCFTGFTTPTEEAGA